MDNRKDLDIRNSIIETGRLLYSKGLIAGRDGNISVRTGKSTMLTTCSGIHKGFMKVEDLVELDFSGLGFPEPVKSRGCKPSTEALLHAEIYRKSREAGAIIHAHAPYSTALGLRIRSGEMVDMTSLAEGRLLFGKVPVVPEFPPGSEELATATASYFPANSAVILKAHGAVAAGRDIMDALSVMEALEHNARILAIAASIGRV